MFTVEVKQQHNIWVNSGHLAKCFCAKKKSNFDAQILLNFDFTQTIACCGEKKQFWANNMPSASGNTSIFLLFFTKGNHMCDF